MEATPPKNLDRRRKPKVFLSHSRTDQPFIQRTYDDLLRCQIEPWLDTVDIRHGEPWLDAIFEGGIAACDSVLIYLTPASIASPMVKKELDAGLLQKLKDRHVAVLPYISDSNLRDDLRVDLQGLQIVEWNDVNYFTVLPQIVAEVWRSFMERNIAAAVNAERVMRLEAQLAVENLKSQMGAAIFTAAEDKDFEYIFTKLNRKLAVTYELQGPDEQSRVIKLAEATYMTDLLPTLLRFVSDGHVSFSNREFLGFLSDKSVALLPSGFKLKERHELSAEHTVLMADELQLFGLVELRAYVTAQPYLSREGMQYRQVPGHRREFTSKMDRFRYWLKVNQEIPPGGVGIGDPGFEWEKLAVLERIAS
jgi:hypothetical protein